MDSFSKLFGSLLALVYHCFDRIVIQGYLPLLTRPAHIVHFFRDVHGIYPITKQALRKRTQEYQQWVDAFARNHHVPIKWPDKVLKNVSPSLASCTVTATTAPVSRSMACSAL
jgi:hypothetical protein